MPPAYAAMKYRSYAKINLYLDVLDKRPDGFNNIETIFQTAGLFDELAFEERKNRVTLTCSGAELDTGEGNLVYRAAMLLREYTGCRQGARIHLEKHIPVAAGLAGGSGNAAATLIALNELWETGLRLDQLRTLAGELGSDVPYCTLGGTAAATGRGEELEALPFIGEQWLILVHPHIAVSAAHIYNHPALERNLQAPEDGRTPAFRAALNALRNGTIAGHVFNRMESAVFADHPRLKHTKQQLSGQGCTAAAVSGSGPTLFGLCEDKRHAESVAAALSEHDSSVVCVVPVGVERVD